MCAAGLVPNPSLFSATTVTGSSSTEDKEGREAHGWGGGQELVDTLFWKFPPPSTPRIIEPMKPSVKFFDKAEWKGG